MIYDPWNLPLALHFGALTKFLIPFYKLILNDLRIVRSITETS